ncbi:hypothetical protein BDA99DRAFT_505924 [Phascolomyces articulosus]|uniref:F-box domain-containing protein n=1 Tax=Phascolomyces articulosus TaxID=60185 RepID=A0AAD5PFF5_9FUNG|nr:hypothetical protein BDA99DRAFT_505924 [Phascolomyces articulosus]
MMTTLITSIYSTTQISELPIELQHSILNHLTFRECIQCTKVSKSWAVMILSWQKMWQCLSTQEKHRIVPHLLPYKNFISGSSVKRIYIDRFGSDPAYWPSVVDFLVDQQCNAIQEGNYIHI